MKRVSFLVGLAMVCLVAEHAGATDVQLTLTSSTVLATTGTWQLSATLSDNQSLGIVSFSIDVLGSSTGPSSGVTVLRAATTTQTLRVSNPPYSLFRTFGTLSAPNVTGIGASQDTIAAANNGDPTIVRFGDGLLTTATGQFYGAIAPGGPLLLATGRWIASGTGGTIQAILTPGTAFDLFPLNYAVDDGFGGPPPAGSAQIPIAAANVVASQAIFMPGVFPEPGSIVLMALGSVALMVVARRARQRE